MNIRILFALALAMTLAPAAMGQANAPAKKTWSVSRTPDGQPDLQGIWNSATIRPLERPAELAGKEFFIPQVAAEYVKQTIQSSNADRRDGGSEPDVGRAYNEFWRTRGGVVSTRRTSLIIDPPD